MEYSQLKAFYQVALSKNFSKAAEELFITQPTLSRQIAALEKELGLQLFIRKGRQAVLTDAGRRLFNYAEKILSLSSEARKEMADLNDLSTGELTIGACTTIANYLLPEVLALFKRQNPDIKIDLKIGNTTEIEELTHKAKINFGLIAGDVESTGIYKEDLIEDELFLIVSSDKDLSNTDSLLYNFIENETLLLREEGSHTKKSVDKLLERENTTPKEVIYLGDSEAIKRGVIHDMGVSFLSKYTFQLEEKLGLLKPVKELQIKRPFSAIYLKNTRLSPAALSFSAMLKKYFSQNLYQHINHILP